MPQTVPQRTLRHRLRLYRQAEVVHGNGYVGLIPHTAARGNRTPKLAAPTREALVAFIATHYEDSRRPSLHAVYSQFVHSCDTQNIPAPSYRTFVTAVHARPTHAQEVRRRGTRAAYPHEPTYWELTPTTPRHGDRPFEICHIDHTELDVVLVDSNTARPLGRPWATFLMDAYSRRVLAVSLSFDPPSYRACLTILRECVRRHNRLPDTLVVDGGSEFGSVYFETVLARYACTKKTRPAAKPRFGAVCERLFGTTNTAFIHTLRGNTQILDSSRLLLIGFERTLKNPLIFLGEEPLHAHPFTVISKSLPDPFLPQSRLHPTNAR